MKVEVMRSRARSGVATKLGRAMTNLNQSRPPSRYYRGTCDTHLHFSKRFNNTDHGERSGYAAQ